MGKMKPILEAAVNFQVRKRTRSGRKRFLRRYGPSPDPNIQTRKRANPSHLEMKLKLFWCALIVYIAHVNRSRISLFLSCLLFCCFSGCAICLAGLWLWCSLYNREHSVTMGLFPDLHPSNSCLLLCTVSCYERYSICAQQPSISCLLL